MGKQPHGGRNAARAAAQQRSAELRAIQARKERQKRQLTVAATVVAILVIAGAVAVAISLNKGKDIPDPTATSGGATSAQVVSRMTSVPASVFDAVGVGSAAETAKPAKLDGAGELKVDGKPRVLYVGAEYCPFCAMERWSLVTALSRFGTWEGLELTSAPAETNIQEVPTVSFVKAKFTSDYLSWTGVETENARREPLQQLTAEDDALVKKFDAPPYQQGSGSIPFVLWGGLAANVGATFDAQLLQGKTAAEVSSGLADAKSDTAQAVLGSANMKTAYLCTLTGQKPAAVCTSAGVKAAAAKLS